MLIKREKGVKGSVRSANDKGLCKYLLENRKKFGVTKKISKNGSEKCVVLGERPKNNSIDHLNGSLLCVILFAKRALIFVSIMLFFLILYNSLKNTNFNYYYEEEGEDVLLNAEKRLGLKTLLKCNNTDENESIAQINKRFKNIEDNIIGLNRKISTVVEMNEEEKNIEKLLREKINDDVKMIGDNLVNMSNDFNGFKEKITKDVSMIKSDKVENTKKDSRDEIKVSIDSLKKNITEMKKISDNLRTEFEDLYREIKLVDENQVVLKSMILSMNKRATQPHLDPIQCSQQSLQFTREVEEYIHELIQIQYEMRGHNRIDWAQSSMGGKVVYPRENIYCRLNKSNNERSPLIKAIVYIQNKVKNYLRESKVGKNGKIIPIYNNVCFEPNDLVNSNAVKTTGNCLLIPINSNIVIELATLINISSVGIDHIASQIDYSSGETVPRNISMECIETPFERGETHYFTYEYPQNTNTLQIYHVSPNMACKKVRFSIVSSYGKSHVCLYKIRIYGESNDNIVDHKNHTEKGVSVGIFHTIINEAHRMLLLQLKGSVSFTMRALRTALKYVNSLVIHDLIGYKGNENEASKKIVDNYRENFEYDYYVSKSGENKVVAAASGNNNKNTSESSDLESSETLNITRRNAGNHRRKRGRELI